MQNHDPTAKEQIENIKIFIPQKERVIFLSRENIENSKNEEVFSVPFSAMHEEIVKIHGIYRIVIGIETLGCNLYAIIMGMRSKS